MSRPTLRLRVTTFAFLLASSGAVADPLWRQGAICSEAGGGALDEFQLLQKSVLVTTASKPATPGMDGQATASAHVVLSRASWPAIVSDKVVVVLGVGVTAMAVLALLYFCAQLPVQHRRSQKTVELSETGEANELKTNMQQQQFKMLEDVKNWNWNGDNWQGRWTEAMLRI